MSTRNVDESLQAAAASLLANPLLNRAQDPEAFGFVCVHRDELIDLFERYAGWRLQVDMRAGFARLYKRGPADPTRPVRRSRGDKQPFSRRHYELLCVALGELLSTTTTTIGELSQSVAVASVAVDGVDRYDSTVRAERSKFVDVLDLLDRYGVLMVDGLADAYIDQPDADALLRVETGRISRLLAADVSPSLLDPSLTADEAVAAIEYEPRYGSAPADPTSVDAEQRNRWMRHTLLRAVLDDPSLLDADHPDELAAYRTNARIRSDMQQVSRRVGLVLEERAEGVAAIATRSQHSDVSFPTGGGTVVQAALLLCDRVLAPAGEEGDRELRTVTRTDLVGAAASLFDEHPRWARSYQTSGPQSLVEDVVALLVSLRLVTVEGDEVTATPPLARYTAVKPSDKQTSLLGGYPV